VAYFTHGVDDIILSDCARPICIKLVENGLKHSVVQKLLNVQGRHDKFCVINFSISLIVYLIYYLVDFVVRNINVGSLNSNFKLRSINEPSTILINGSELLPKLLDLILVGHFDQHIHGRFLKLTNPLERLESLHNIDVDAASGNQLALLHLSEPLVF